MRGRDLAWAMYRLLSVVEVNGQLVIEATVTRSEFPDPCFSYSADFLLSASAGTAGRVPS